MNNRNGSIVAQTLINLVIFAMFMHIAFLSMQRLSKPLTIHHLKYAYIQLQLDYLSSLYHGVALNNDEVCFKEDYCLKYNHQRLILTPGYQILFENIQAYETIDLEEFIRIKVLHLDQWVEFDVKK